MDAERKDFLQPFLDYLNVSNGESDRGKFLIAAAKIDGMLEDILRAFFMPGAHSDELFHGPNAPLSSLYNKANLARSMGIVTADEFDTVGILRKVRNRFAHQVHLSTDDQGVRDQISNLKFGLSVLIERDDPVINDPKTRFSMATSSLITSLYNRAHHVSKRACVDIEWPQ